MLRTEIEQLRREAAAGASEGVRGSA
jgi:hypothetical protein